MNFELILATSNKHKVQEVRKILSPHGIIVYGLNDLNLKPEEVIEDGVTYQANALKKAQSVQKLTSMPIIADDSGIEVEALDNKPGLHSARFAESEGGYINAMNKIIKATKDKNNNNARFVCDIVLLNVDEKPLLFEGIANGHIKNEIIGDSGFGYDPIFYYDELGKTFAELTEDEKNKVSHRARALKKLLTYLKINQLIK